MTLRHADRRGPLIKGQGKFEIVAREMIPISATVSLGAC